MRISSLLILILTMFVIIITFLTSFFIYQQVENRLKQEVIHNLQYVSNSREEIINTFLDSQLDKLKLIATQQDLTNEELKQMISEDDEFTELFVLNSQGKVTSASELFRLGMDRSMKDYFLEGQKNLSGIVPVYYSNVTDQYGIAFYTPFHDSVLVARTNFYFINNLLSNHIGLGDTGESLMAYIDDNQNIVFFTTRRVNNLPQKISLEEAEANNLPIYQALMKKEELIENTKDYRGVPVIAVTNYFPNVNLGMVTKIDNDEAFGILKKELIRLIIILSVFNIIIFSGIALLLSYLITKPIQQLDNDIENITKGDLTINLQQSNITEIQNLINSLQRILSSLKLAILRTGATKEEFGLGELKKAKEEAENKFKILYDSSNDAIMTLGPPTWKFTAGNQSTIKMFNTKDEKEFTSLGPWDISPEKQPDGQLSIDKSKKMIEKAMKDGQNLFEWTHKRYQGEDFVATVLLSKVKINGKDVLQATVRDISEEKKKSEQLEKFVKFAHGREEKVLELKNTIKDSEAKLKINSKK